MGIDRDDYGEREARVDGMIKEFREAQARRTVATPSTVESPPEVAPKGPERVTGLKVD